MAHLVSTRGALRGLVGLVLLALLGLGCASTSGPAKVYTVTHEGFGVRADLEGWQVFTDAASAPAVLRPAFVGKQGPDDPPLFVALKGGVIFVAIVRPAAGGDAKGLFDVLAAEVQKQGDVTRAIQLEGSDDILFGSRIGPGAVAAHSQNLVHVGSGRLVNLMVSMTGTPVPDAAVVDALSRFELRDADGWRAPWQGLDAPIAGTALAGYETPLAEVADPFEDVTCAPGEHPALWRLATPSGRVFLFGSIHFGHPSFYPFPAVIESAFAGSARLAVEARVDAPEAQDPSSALFEGMGLPAGKLLKDVISPELYERLQRAAVQMGLPDTLFDAMSPSVAGLTLATLPFIQRGFDPRDGVDTYFLGRAAAKEILELESLAEQLALIQQFESVFLESSLDGLETVDEDIEALYRSWRCGDVAALDELIFERPRERVEAPEQEAALDAFNEAFLIGRNERMTTKIVELLKRDGDTFVVVGAAHLVGEQGIPALLRAAGHAVERVGP